MRAISIGIGIATLVCFNLSGAKAARAWTYYLQRDLGIQGVEHLCRYSNGKIYAIPATELCDLSIEDSAPGFGTGTGFLKGNFMQGMSTVCVYDVLGEERAISLGGMGICPLTHNFQR